MSTLKKMGTLLYSRRSVKYCSCIFKIYRQLYLITTLQSALSLVNFEIKNNHRESLKLTKLIFSIRFMVRNIDVKQFKSRGKPYLHPIYQTNIMLFSLIFFKTFKMKQLVWIKTNNMVRIACTSKSYFFLEKLNLPGFSVFFPSINPSIRT